MLTAGIVPVVLAAVAAVMLWAAHRRPVSELDERLAAVDVELSTGPAVAQRPAA